MFSGHDPANMGGSRGGGTGAPDPPKNHKNIGFPINIDPGPFKFGKPAGGGSHV